MKLQGITGPANKRLAVINNRTFAAGDAGEVKIDGKPVKLRCLEIREKSMLLQIGGVAQPKELTLPD